jgi:sulfoxide reductase heme-binding subunit YedZ
MDTTVSSATQVDRQAMKRGATGQTQGVASRQRSLWLHPTGKPALFVIGLLPFAWLFYGAWTNTLGANPAEALIRASGDWTLRFLCLTLAISPVRQWFNLPPLVRFRRMVGLFTFFYATSHFLSYAWLDQGFALDAILRDISKRPFILVGSLAMLLLTPLAATSFNRAIKWMGASRWRALHRTVYAIAGLGLLHFFWMRAAKNNFAEVAVYAAIISAMLGWRLNRWIKSKQTKATG